MALRSHGGPRALARKREKPSRPARVLLRRMFGYFGPFKRVVVAGAVFSLLATILSAVSPVVLGRGIDLAFYGGGCLLYTSDAADEG